MKNFNTLIFLLVSFFASAQDSLFVEKTPNDLGAFLVKTADGKMGVVDDKDSFIIPLDTVVLRQWFPPKSKFYIRGKRQRGQKFNQHLYDSSGKLLFSNVSIGYVGLGTHSDDDDKSHRNYFMIEQKGILNKLLFHKESGQILPDSFAFIDYGGANSTFLATHISEKGKSKIVSVFGLDGKKHFTLPPEIRVMHTGHPNILLATKFDPHKKALVFIDKGLDSIAFEFDALRKMRTGWFVFSKDKRQHYGLLDPNGIPSGKSDFTKLGEPNRAQKSIFHAKIGSYPIATGIRDGMEKPAWIGIDSLGKEHVFTDDAPGETIGQREDRLRRENAGKKRRKLPDGSTLGKPPTFPGGESAMTKYIASNLLYPTIARENGSQGTVILQLVVEADGRLTNISIRRDIGNGCGFAAVQCFKQMPRWSPAVDNGKKVASVVAVPVYFKLKK